jgi:hypothetical protein
VNRGGKVPDFFVVVVVVVVVVGTAIVKVTEAWASFPAVSLLYAWRVYTPLGKFRDVVSVQVLLALSTPSM